MSVSPRQKTSARGTPAKKAPAKPRARKAQATAPRRASAPKATDAPSGLGAGALAGAVAGGVCSGIGFSARALGRGLWAVARSRDFQRLSAIGVLAGCLFGTSGLVRERVQSWDQFKLRLELRADAPPPPGLSQAATHDLAAIRLPKQAHAFHEGVIPGLAAHLQGLPWVAKVEELRLQAPARIELKLRTHRPLAQLGPDEGPLVAREGDLIPRRYGAKAERLPRILGAPAGEAQRAALQLAVEVLSVLGPLAAQVEAVDLSNLGGRRDPRASEVVLTLAGGLLVDWGRAEPADAAGAAAAKRSEDASPTPESLGPPRRGPEEKRADLEAFLASFPQIALVERVSLRFDEVTYTLREAGGGSAITRR